MDLLTHDYFENLIGQDFELRADDQTFALRVVEVAMLPPPRRRTLTGKTQELPVKRAPFSVFFRTEGEHGLPQGTFQMKPPDGDEALTIFLVPLGSEDGGVLYEAVFN